jgi:hypothetical protein
LFSATAEEGDEEELAPEHAQAGDSSSTPHDTPPGVSVAGLGSAAVETTAPGSAKADLDATAQSILLSANSLISAIDNEDDDDIDLGIAPALHSSPDGRAGGGTDQRRSSSAPPAVDASPGGIPGLALESPLHSDDSIEDIINAVKNEHPVAGFWAEPHRTPDHGGYGVAADVCEAHPSTHYDALAAIP